MSEEDIDCKYIKIDYESNFNEDFDINEDGDCERLLKKIIGKKIIAIMGYSDYTGRCQLSKTTDGKTMLSLHHYYGSFDLLLED